MNNQQPKKAILVVTPYYYQMKGGLVTMTTSLVTNLRKLIPVIVLVTSQGKDPRNNSSQHGNLIFFPAKVPYGGDNKIKALAGWFVSLATDLVRLSTIVHRNNIKIMHLHFATYHLFVYSLYSKISGIPYIVTLHGSDVTQFSKSHYLNRVLVYFSLKRANKIIAVSQALASHAIKNWPHLSQKISVIHNGVDIPTTRQKPNHGTVHVPSTDYFICVGNLVHVKAFELAIEAWNIINTRNINPPHLVIVGGGEEKEYYRELIEKHGLGDIITLTGPVQRDIALSYMEKSLAVIVPSRSEGLPYTILEAGLLCKPVIATPVGGIVEIIENEKHGILVTKESPESIADAVTRLIHDQQLAKTLASHLHERIKNDFTTQVMTQRYNSIYIDLMK